MKKLIIAEKASLAKSIVNGIKTREKIERKTLNGFSYFESDQYIVCAARGHLYTLYDVEDYDAEGKVWVLDKLPFFPKKFLFRPLDSDTEKIALFIKSLLIRTDVNEIINAGDAGREGELLVRLILLNLRNTKPVKRIWLPAQTPEDINNGLDHLEEESKRNDLYTEGLARMYADWLDGINITRFASLKSKSFLRIGRVASTIVKIIYDRELERHQFVAEKSYNVISQTVYLGTDINLKSSYNFKENEKQYANKLATTLNEMEAKVVSLEKNIIKKEPPFLFSQSNLQNYMNQYFKFEPFTTLEVCQNLYEKGFISYPRTSSEFLATSEKEIIERRIGRFRSLGEKVLFNNNNRIFDDSRIDEHSGLTPTLLIPDEESLTINEQLTYKTIKNRFLAVFCEQDRLIMERKIKLKIGDFEEFILTDERLESEGFGFYENSYVKKNTLPNFQIGDVLKPNFKVFEKVSKAKDKYTVTSLNRLLKFPLSSQEDQENTSLNDFKMFLEGVTIGTEASTPEIIKKICNDELIEIDGHYYNLLSKGKYLVEVLRLLNIEYNINKTIEFNVMLKKIYQKQSTIDSFIQEIKNNISNTIESSKNIEIPRDPALKKVLCKCHHCTGDIIIANKIYFCDKCGFKLFKEDHWWTSKGKEITDQIAKKLIENKSVLINDFHSNTKKNNYTAIVTMIESDNKISFCLDFNHKK